MLIDWLAKIATLLHGEIDWRGVDTAVLLVPPNPSIVLIEGEGCVVTWAVSGRSGEFSPPLGPQFLSSGAAVSVIRQILNSIQPHSYR